MSTSVEDPITLRPNIQTTEGENKHSQSISSRGLFAPGMKDMSAYFNGMFEGVVADRLNNGCKLPTYQILVQKKKTRNTARTFTYVGSH